jgi:hypothetical protein
MPGFGFNVGFVQFGIALIVIVCVEGYIRFVWATLEGLE